MDFKKKNDDGIVEKLVHINRITKVVKGGRRFGFSALIGRASCRERVSDRV